MPILMTVVIIITINIAEMNERSITPEHANYLSGKLFCMWWSACLEMYMPVQISEGLELNITVILIPIYDEMIESQPGFIQMRKSVPAGWVYTAAAPVCDVSSEGARNPLCRRKSRLRPRVALCALFSAFSTTSTCIRAIQTLTDKDFGCTYAKAG